MNFRTLLAPVLLGAITAPGLAQSLELDVVGGSMPGPLTISSYPGLYAFEFILIVPSTSSGPTPLQLIDPNDLRSMSIGLDLLSSMWVGAADLNTLRVDIPTALGVAPPAVGLPLYMQAVTLQWLPTLVGRISNPNVIHLGLADTFQDRLVGMFEQRAFSTAVVRERQVLVVGGARGQLLAQVATATTDRYDPMTDMFVPGPTMSTPRSMHTMTELADGRHLLVGGVDGGNNPQNTCEIYDPVTDTFTPAAAMASARMGHTANLLPNGLVLVTGGIEAMPLSPTQLEPIHNTLATTELYDPVTDTWSAGPALTTPRAAHAALQRPDGNIVLCGGVSWSPHILFGWVPAVRSSCDLYDPVANTIVAGPSMAAQRALADPVELSPGRWLLAGGMNGLSVIPWNPGNPTDAAEIYDASTNSWTTVGPLGTARANHKGFALGNGRYLLAGGGANSVLSPTPLTSTEIFDTATNTFSPGPVMNYGRGGATMIHTPQGQVMMIGGADTATTITTSVEWYYF